MNKYLIQFLVALVAGVVLSFQGAPHWAFTACIATAIIVKFNELE